MPPKNDLDQQGSLRAHAYHRHAPNLNQELVKQGWCWWYRKYAPGDTVLEGLENIAREDRSGLWADPQPVPPCVRIDVVRVFPKSGGER